MKDFEDLSWQEFEDYVIALFGRIYGADGLKVYKTDYQKDGGKDGYAAFRVGPPTIEGGKVDLSIPVKIWIEVKKRSGSVGLTDIGGHLILAINEHVNKILFVTNSYFTPRTRASCEQLGQRLNVGVTFFTGDDLREWENRFATAESSTPSGASLQRTKPKSAKKSTYTVTVRTCFAANPEADLTLSSVNLKISPGEIAYCILEISSSLNDDPANLTLKVGKTTDGVSAVLLSDGSISLDRTGGIRRVVIAIWSELSGEIDLSDIGLKVTCSDKRARVDIQPGKGIMNVQASILRRRPFGTQRVVLEAAQHDLRRVSFDASVACLLLEAPAGVGKSYALDLLRRMCLKNKAREVRLDGELHRRVGTVASAVLQQAFPLPASIARNVEPEILHEWLCTVGVRDLASLDGLGVIADLFENPDSTIVEDVLIALVAATLIHGSSKTLLIVTFEDLHKANASVLRFIQRLIGFIAANRKGSVYFVLTTRPHRGIGSEETQTQWETALREFGAGQAIFSHRRLSSPNIHDAIELLCESLHGLSQFDASRIVEQVGTNPFRLREALEYLYTIEVIQFTQKAGPHVLDSEGIAKVIESELLRTATQERIKILVQRNGEWIERFLLLGACMGKTFSSQIVTEAEFDLQEGVFYNAMSILERYEVVRTSGADATGEYLNLSFDHDLVREAVLAATTSSQIRLTASHLCAHVDAGRQPQTKLVLLLLANASERATILAERLLEQAHDGQNYLEALQFALARAYVLFGVGERRRLPANDFLRGHMAEMDRALLYVDPPTAPSWVDEATLTAVALAPLREMDHIGVMEDELSRRLISLGSMNAEVCHDAKAGAQFLYFDGRRLFSQSRYDEAFSRFTAAEEAWPNGKTGRDRDLAGIRLRIAICERHLGRREDAQRTMMRALRLRNGVDWQLFQEVMANQGAFEMYSNQAAARRYWSKGLRAARRIGNMSEITHFMNDLGHLTFMEGRYEEALSQIDGAADLAHKHGVIKEQIRANIFRGCLFMVLGDTVSAKQAFLQAEDAATSHSNFRRLWRIYANLATIAELEGRWLDALVADQKAVHQMLNPGETIRLAEAHNKFTREFGALVNINLRARRNSETYKEVQERIASAHWRYFDQIAGALLVDEGRAPRVVGGGSSLYHKVGDGSIKRFLITE